jgi:hypothetical protein
VIRSIAVLLLLALFAVPAAAATPVGTVERVHGVCTGTVDGETRTLAAQAPVHLNEEIVTGDGARIAIVLDDGTVLTIGENARLTIDAFVLAPAGAGVLHATVAGAFRYVSGALRQGATPEASVTTPVAVIGVRGTDFWGGPIDGGFGVALFEGSISVTSGGVTTVLDAAGSGVNLPAAGGAPVSVTTWPDEKVQRAMSAVAFP